MVENIVWTAPVWTDYMGGLPERRPFAYLSMLCFLFSQSFWEPFFLPLRGFGPKIKVFPRGNGLNTWTFFFEPKFFLIQTQVLI